MRTALCLFAAALVVAAAACARDIVGPDANEVDAGGPPASPAPDAAATASACPDGHQPTDPIDYGACEVTRALSDVKSDAVVHVAVATDPLASGALAAAGVTVENRPESYAIVSTPQATFVVGHDPVGAMYGALETAERLRDDGPAALPLTSPSTGTPSIALRAANPFLVLPTGGETTATWWFRDPSFWTEYLDLMAHARLDFLDLHAMYDPVSTLFPNALLYFGTSQSFPSVGVSAEDRASNVAALQMIVSMAAVRGIHVGLMSYRSDTSPLADGTGPTLSDADLQTYTREAVADIARRVPGLVRLGFRIGESGKDAAWYTATYVAGVNDAGTGVKVYTRTWGTTKPEILSLAAAAGADTIVEAKYNGEQFAAPYPIEGASFAGFGAYSYQGYLDPPAPYGFVFQVRAAGTHRIFRFAHFERARRTAASMGLSPRIEGLTFEPPHAYSPQRDFYHAPQDVFSPWTFRRDELAYMLVGRLAYDPTTPEPRFRAMLAARVGTDALWDALQAASDIVPWIQTTLTCGADSRDYAPELELGGDVAWWASPAGSSATCNHHIAFDGFSVAMPAEAAADLVAGRATTKLAPTDVAQIVLADAQRARAAAQVSIDAANAEARDVVRECIAEADLGEWFSHKLRAATALAVYERTAAADWLAVARAEVALAASAFQQLATDTTYIAPFEERLRMQGLGYLPFHWSEEVPRLSDDAAAIDTVVQQIAQNPPAFQGTLPAPSAWLDATRATGPGLAALAVSPADASAATWTVNVTLTGAPPPGAAVRVLWKPFDSGTDWAATDASGAATAWTATVAGGGAGGVFAVEIAGSPGQGWRLPDVLRETPYRVLAP